MKKVLVFGAALAFAVSAMAEKKEINGQWYSMFPTKANAEAVSHYARGGGGSNLVYHNGDVLVAAKVVPIFWGTYWSSGTGASQAATMELFYEQFGTNSHYGVITQYYDTVYGGTRTIGLSTLTNSGDAWYDSTNPTSANVTDAMVQAEVNAYLAGHGYKALDSHGVDQAIYEVFIGPAYFSSNGTSGSCGATGGVSLAYCAYHGSFSTSAGGATKTVKYSIEPYPSCSGCKTSGWSDVNNMQHFACHETREAVTDPVSGWWDNRGYEADDKCAWSPTPFIDGGYGYQYEWSNKNGACVK
ncbi:MAG TPA: hypothetical protein VFS34_14445 [Thermoanaerobaculia bacterium]|nr:hypothetical protein [Thermoanaerobaculia bacterium]